MWLLHCVPTSEGFEIRRAQQPGRELRLRLNTLSGLIQAIQDRMPAARDMKPEPFLNYVGRALDAYNELKLIPSSLERPH
jgi:hypothetical protein